MLTSEYSGQYARAKISNKLPWIRELPFSTRLTKNLGINLLNPGIREPQQEPRDAYRLGFGVLFNARDCRRKLNVDLRPKSGTSPSLTIIEWMLLNNYSLTSHFGLNQYAQAVPVISICLSVT